MESIQACLSLRLLCGKTPTVCAEHYRLGLRSTSRQVNRVIFVEIISIHALTLASRTGKRFDGILYTLWPLVPRKLRPYGMYKYYILLFYLFKVLSEFEISNTQICQQTLLSLNRSLAVWAVHKTLYDISWFHIGHVWNSWFWMMVMEIQLM